MTKLILASASASRRKLLTAAGVAFDISPADLDEPALIASLQNVDHAHVAQALAEAKALAVSQANPGRLVLGGDSVLSFGGQVISKCPDIASLRTLLQRLAGRTHILISAAALARDGQIVWAHHGIAHLEMRNFSPAFLEDYLEKTGADVLSSVGGYHYEGLGAQLFARTDGDYFTILGLPLLPLLAALREHGIVQA